MLHRNHAARRQRRPSRLAEDDDSEDPRRKGPNEMNFADYQERAQETDQKPAAVGDGLVMALMGLVGEAVTLLAEYKKVLRDGPAHRGFQTQVAEELGDLLWYIANIATKCGHSLDDIAVQNLMKTRARWLP